ncbi:MAG: LysR family transcriptional regulator [Betaproteobacteria bacterium]|nr:LysR family transcriptional regulator [Betaproteobacteria bacterium]MDE2048062.1 LysR family transcriptional regulator [Betaproteobacteria bacterium]
MSARDGIDSYLLRVLFTLIQEKNVSRTAVKLNQSQPAISTALKRLREMTGDELLVRSKAGMVPTDYALSLVEPLRLALAAVDKITRGVPVFNAATTRRRFRIASPDYMDAFFLPRAVCAIRTLAPSAEVELHSLNSDYDFERALEDGTLDLVVGNWPDPPEHLHLLPLLDDDVVVLMRNDHPLTRKPMTQELYLQAPHLAPSPYAASQRGLIDVHLGRERLQRRVVVTAPYFSLAPYMLLETDLLFTTSRHFAEHFARFLPLRVVESPVQFPRMRFYTLWHERTHANEECQWLRGVLQQAARELTRKDMLKS